MKTGLDWLIEKVMGDHTAIWQKEINKAREMYKDEIIFTYSTGWHDGQDVIIGQVKHVDHGGDAAGEKYFEDTY